MAKQHNISFMVRDAPFDQGDISSDVFACSDI